MGHPPSFKQRTAAPARALLDDIDATLWRAEAPTECGCGCGIPLDDTHTSLDFASLMCQELWHQFPGHDVPDAEARAQHRASVADQYNRYRWGEANKRTEWAEPEPWTWPGSDMAVAKGYDRQRLLDDLHSQCHPEEEDVAQCPAFQARVAAGTLPPAPDGWDREGRDREDWHRMTPSQQRVWMNVNRRRVEAPALVPEQPVPERDWRLASLTAVERVMAMFGERVRAENALTRERQRVLAEQLAPDTREAIQARMVRVTLMGTAIPNLLTEQDVIARVEAAGEDDHTLVYDARLMEWRLA